MLRALRHPRRSTSVALYHSIQASLHLVVVRSPLLLYRLAHLDKAFKLNSSPRITPQTLRMQPGADQAQTIILVNWEAFRGAADLRPAGAEALPPLVPDASGGTSKVSENASKSCCK